MTQAFWANRFQVSPVPAPAMVGRLVATLSILALSACGSGVSGTASTATVSTAKVCPALPGEPWVPEIEGVGRSNHTDSNIKSYSAQVTSAQVTVTAINQGFSETLTPVTGIASVGSVNFSVDDDLGSQGSLTLQAEVVDVPSAITSDDGVVYPVLISLTDPSGREFVKLSGCDSGGFYSCSSSGSCAKVSTCGPDSGSAYLGDSITERRAKWEQHQKLLSLDAVSVNSFPTCNWSTTSPVGSSLACPFDPTSDSSFFVSGKLRSGTYRAKYVLSSNYVDVVPGNSVASVKLSVIKKKDSNSASDSKGAIDLNVVLVGKKNIEDSRTDKGKQNLNALFTHVANHYAQSNTKIKIGSVDVYEWGCEHDGDAYAEVAIENTGKMIKAGSTLLGVASTVGALNVFLVSSFGGSASILGRAGAIIGAPLNGASTSGSVFASFDLLASYNSQCTGVGACPVEQQEWSFIDMGSTISHELGHFLGLNHPSESSGTTHDKIIDTPICTNLSVSAGRITTSSCLADSNVHPTEGMTCRTACNTGANQTPLSCGSYDADTCFCPAADACQFNHVMWYTGKFYGTGGLGDGNIFSPQSSEILNYSPFVK